MPRSLLSPPLHRPDRLFLRLAGVAALFFPALVLWVAAQQARSDWQQTSLYIGAIIDVGLAIWLIRTETLIGAMRSKVALAFYAFALLVVWRAMPDFDHWFPHLAIGLLLTTPLLFLALQELYATGASAPRRAHLLLTRLTERKEWPVNLAECRNLPEVRGLRDTLHHDPTPALMLLMHPRPEVRFAVLAALAYRPRWKRGQALLILQVARHAPEPQVRCAAVTALAFITDPHLLTHLGSFLRDPISEVRRATAEALFADIRERWAVVRSSVRSVLADPRCGADGPLPIPGPLPATALGDLTVWSGEIGTVGKRSALTLINYYRVAMQEGASPQLIAHLCDQMISPRVPAAIRVEIAPLLRDSGGLPLPVLGRLLESDQPSALRLMAAEALLQNGPDERAVAALRDVARQPNRELAIAAAVIIQKWLRIDMGLPIGQPPPPPQSKQGAEVTRRVMQWAAAAREALAADTPVPEPTPPRPVPRPLEPPPLEPPPLPPAVPDQPATKGIDTKTPWIW
jgi:hypothetical protein